MQKLLKSALLDKGTEQVSWSKVWAWITSGLMSVVLLQDQLTAAGIALPVGMLPWFKVAGVLSGLITAIRLRNSIK